MPKQTKVIAILFLFLFYGISFSQNNICEYDAGDILQTYIKGINASNLNKKDIYALKRVKQFITNKELENLFILKEDDGFRGNFKKGRNKCNIHTDFSFSSFETIYDMFKYCNSVVSEKYDSAKIRLDKFFMEKDLLNELKVAGIEFFYFDYALEGEIYLYNYAYCKNDYDINSYSPTNSMLLSTNNPYDDVYNTYCL